MADRWPSPACRWTGSRSLCEKTQTKGSNQMSAENEEQVEALESEARKAEINYFVTGAESIVRREKRSDKMDWFFVGAILFLLGMCTFAYFRVGKVVK
jgi:hypothetical protein